MRKYNSRKITRASTTIQLHYAQLHLPSGAALVKKSTKLMMKKRQLMRWMDDMLSRTMFVCLNVCLSVCLYVCLSVCSCVCRT